MNNYYQLRYVIIPEINVIRTNFHNQYKSELEKLMKENNINGEIIIDEHFIGQFIRFDTSEDMILFKLKFNQLPSEEWKKELLSYYSSYESFLEHMIYYFEQVDRKKNLGKK